MWSDRNSKDAKREESRNLPVSGPRGKTTRSRFIGALGSLRLPRSVERVAVRRLGNLSAGFGALFLVATVVRGFVIHKVLPLTSAPIGVAVENMWLANTVTLIFSVALFSLFALTRTSLPAWKVLKLGLLVELGMSFGLCFEEQILFDFFNPLPSPSFSVVIILTFPLLIPTPWPRRIAITLVSSLMPLAALPVSMMITGRAMPDLQALVGNVIPMVIVGVFALYAARIAHQLRTQADAARQIGSYELLEQIGEGAMGQVWRAKHRLLARDAALKLIQPDAMGEDPEHAETRFEREARATAALASPHTVALYDYGRSDEGTYYYAMELLDGLTLDSMIRTHGPLPEARALYLLRQIALSLAEAHRAGLVHRDVKPANVFVSSAGIEQDYIKVLDFGLVKSTSRTARDVQLTQEHVPTGTPAF
ncbi:MAG: serine/threonine-protein kinase, partial [Myxococcota bacterium]